MAGCEGKDHVRGKLSDFTGNLSLGFRRKTIIIIKMHAKSELFEISLVDLRWSCYILRCKTLMGNY